jgi:hypothetical protein
LKSVAELWQLKRGLQHLISNCTTFQTMIKLIR